MKAIFLRLEITGDITAEKMEQLQNSVVDGVSHAVKSCLYPEGAFARITKVGDLLIDLYHAVGEFDPETIMVDEQFTGII